MPVWAYTPVWSTRLCGPIRPCVPHVQLGLARMADMATLEPSHGCVLGMAMLTLTTQLCLANDHPHGRPHACVASTMAIFDTFRNLVFRVLSTHLVHFCSKCNPKTTRTYNCPTNPSY
ncbi:hypothetical protein J1N35_023279 [Gossypium stocksii]|uniref:Uncharacterized protein n=1 Tax=Gossypium stocksii TaxID=47602 RepID=A0A9D3VI08_9ROSI|nr:hypothetical protein J1N35_023279 [Gossypium stocksii]